MAKIIRLTNALNALDAAKVGAAVARMANESFDGTSETRPKVRFGIGHSHDLKNGAVYAYKGLTSTTYKVENEEVSYYEDIIPMFTRNATKKVALYLSTFSEEKSRVTKQGQIVNLAFPLQDAISALADLSEDKVAKGIENIFKGKKYIAVSVPYAGTYGTAFMWALLQDGEELAVYIDGEQTKKGKLQGTKMVWE